MQAVLIAVKVVGTVMAAKTMIEGLKEGNLLKAVLGGVGAYLGMSSLATPAAAVTAAEAGAATGTALEKGAAAGTAAEAGTAGSASAGTALGTAAPSAATTTVQGFGGSGLIGKAVGAASDLYDTALGLDSVGAPFLDNSLFLPSAAEAAAPLSWGEQVLADAKGLLGKAFDFAKDNQTLVGGVAQGVGNWMMGKEKMDWQSDQLDKDRRLRGATPTGISQYRFDPVSRSMVKVTGA